MTHEELLLSHLRKQFPGHTIEISDKQHPYHPGRWLEIDRTLSKFRWIPEEWNNDYAGLSVELEIMHLLVEEIARFLGYWRPREETEFNHCETCHQKLPNQDYKVYKEGWEWPNVNKDFPLNELRALR